MASVEDLSPEVKAKAIEVGRPSAQLMDRATSHHATAGATDHSGTREAMVHNQGAPGKSQEALSPTDSGKSQTQTQNRVQERGRGIER